MKEFIKKHQYLLLALANLFISIMQVIIAWRRDDSFYLILFAGFFLVAVLYALRYFLGRRAPDEPDDIGPIFRVVRHFRKKESDPLD